MRRLKNKIIDRLGHYLLPELAAIAAFLAFSFQPGAMGDLMRICSALVLLNLIVRNYRLNSPNYQPVYLLLGFLVLLAMNLFVPPDKVHHRSFSYFLAFPGMALTIYYLILNKQKQNSLFSLNLYVPLFSGTILIQFLVAYFGDNRGTLGIYSNLHHLGLFSSILIPLIAYLVIIAEKPWWRLLLVVAGILSFYLMFSSTSKVSWAAFFAGAMLTLIIFLKGRQKIYISLGILFFSLLSGMIFGLSSLVGNIQSLITEIPEEERWTIWLDTLTMLKDNSLLDWLVGHGIGSFRYYFQDYSTYISGGIKFQTNFPHNGFLQILFENGIIGFFIIFGGMLLLLVGIIKAYRVLNNRMYKFMVVTVFATFWIDFIHFILTESIYRKYISYTLSVIVGTMMALISIAKQNDAAATS